MPAVLSVPLPVEKFLRLFYIVSPSRTTFTSLEDIPDYTQEAIPSFVVTISLELVYYLLFDRRGLKRDDGSWATAKWRMNDIVGSITAGSLYTISKFFIPQIETLGYIYVWDHFRVYGLDPTSLPTWIAAFLAADLGYYWFHRMAHEVNFMWAAHVVHHSSEHYNQSTALRQSIFQQLTSWAFYLPAALFIPPSMFFVHRQLTVLYQYWIHTEVVPHLGFLEYIINTPSSHRVHHGRNPYCVDKNYAGTLIIWDRLFGTYEPERVYPQVVARKEDEEPVRYGLVHPINTFNPITVQTHHFVHILKTAYQTPGWINKAKVLVYGPGWHPGTPRTGLVSELPPIDRHNPPPKYDPELPLDLAVYNGLHAVTTIGLSALFFEKASTLSLSAIRLVTGYLGISFYSTGALYDAQPDALSIELVKNVVGCALLEAAKGHSSIPASGRLGLQLLQAFYLGSGVYIGSKLIRRGRNWASNKPKTQ
ncbi:Alkylglycerol monooxygenase [Polychytrium aggregatum]|uniref:Alkylglycerol monooxygenase n=1 Tax=Polychytrium aggregatum TaxID=110093 RepID=UPI0022FF2633|nr:Alkylglycerol monooxygenase [Polychytrium aggregatum]KAI9209921.1 Alkylglycerol monooxygenase [Polychytrium aggregatum]